MAGKWKWEDAWVATAQACGGTLERGRRNKPRRVVFPTDAWTVVLDLHTESTGESATTYTRVRTVYRTRDDFRFRVYRNSLFTGIGKALGMQDLEVGMPDVDRDYVVQSNSLGKVQALLMRREIAEPLARMRAGRLQSRPYRRRGLPGKGWHQLSWEIARTEKETERITDMVRLVQAAIRHLGKTGSAGDEPVPIDL